MPPRKNPAPFIVGGIALVMLFVGLVLIGAQLARRDGPAVPGQPAAARKPQVANDRKLFDQWIQENEGDPRSVEVIEFDGPRNWFGKRTFYAKYRAVNAFGAKQVMAHYFQIDRNGIRCMADWEENSLQYNFMRMPTMD